MDTPERTNVLVIEGGKPDQAAAERINELIRRHHARFSAFLVGPHDERIELPEPLYRAIRDAIEILGRGDAIVIGSLHDKLTTTQAADLLGISRQYLIRLIDADALPHEMVGRHRRLRLGNVLAYRDTRATQRRKALSEMHAVDAELGVYD